MDRSRGPQGGGPVLRVRRPLSLVEEHFQDQVLRHLLERGALLPKTIVAIYFSKGSEVDSGDENSPSFPRLSTGQDRSKLFLAFDPSNRRPPISVLVPR